MIVLINNIDYCSIYVNLDNSGYVLSDNKKNNHLSIYLNHVIFPGPVIIVY